MKAGANANDCDVLAVDVGALAGEGLEVQAGGGCEKLKVSLDPYTCLEVVTDISCSNGHLTVTKKWIRFRGSVSDGQRRLWGWAMSTTTIPSPACCGYGYGAGYMAMVPIPATTSDYWQAAGVAPPQTPAAQMKAFHEKAESVHLDNKGESESVHLDIKGVKAKKGTVKRKPSGCGEKNRPKT